MPVRTAFLLLLGSRTRFLVTVGGIALCILLLGFLVGVYRSVSDGSVEYIRRSRADIWVLQEGTTNILRGFSLLTNAHGTLLRDFSGVRAVSPVLFRLSTIQTAGGGATSYLTGYVPGTPLGGPPSLLEGRGVRSSGEIVLDEAFAQRWSCPVGGHVRIMNRNFLIVGLSGGSNMVALQYAFVHIEDVRELYGVSDLVSVFLVELQDPHAVRSILPSIADEVPGVSVYDRRMFLAQNVKELENGFLPVILVMMTIGSVLLTVIIGLLLTMNVLEHRAEFALLKAIGSPRSFLPCLVLTQSVQLVACATLSALLFSGPLRFIVQRISPEVNVAFSTTDIVLLTVILLLLIGVGTFLPLLRLRGIYPAEAFQ